ncbi:hypothetical protein [Kitasatospora herbaricolor]|uniref:AbiJ-related protein n=1 Tax=Kitasatospora herbaricolor TaxID=68217 RepID=UPI0036D8D5FD
MADTDPVLLRELVESVVPRLCDHLHKEIGQACRRLGLPEPPPEGTRFERVSASFTALPVTDLPAVAQRVLQQRLVEAPHRNAIQDELWAGQDTAQIPKRTRRNMTRDLDLTDLIHQRERFLQLLDDLWVLDDTPPNFPFNNPNALGTRIHQHVFRNPGDWTTEKLFEELGAFEARDPRFLRFLEGMVHPDVLPDEPAQLRLVESVNPHLQAVGVELRETDTDGGYPVFSVVPSSSAKARRPWNLVFASLNKPDLRLRDALDNEIESLSSEDIALYYDRPIGADGIRWRDLQDWWTAAHPADPAAKKSLYNRLKRSIPANSPPAQNLFALYHAIHGPAVPDLPALLPEATLSWDPKTIHSRGPEAALRNHRVDFLLLLPHGQRVVLEVDGAQHYSRGDQADPRAYATTMRNDRELKLRGYEVFRFGGSELRGLDQADALLRQFFTGLFRRFKVTAVRS